MSLIKCKKCSCVFDKNDHKCNTDNPSYYWVFCPKCNEHDLMRYYDESNIGDKFEYVCESID